MVKPNYNLIYHGIVAGRVYLNTVTGEITGEYGFEFPQHRSNSYWDKYHFEPIEGEKNNGKT